MAITSTTVRYNVVGTDNASKAFASAGRSASHLDSTMGRAGASIRKAGKLIAEATAAVAAGSITVGVQSVRMAQDFQTSMTKIQTQAGGSAKDVQELGKQVLKLGGYAEQSPKQLADALFHLKSVGLDNIDAMKALKQASDLAAVGGADLEETTNAIAGAWRSGIRGAQNFGQATKTLNSIVGAGNMKMGDLVEALGTGILPAAKTFGLSLSQVGSALALMTDEGVPAADAATRLRMSFSLLGAPSIQAEKQLKKIGLSGTSLATAMRGPQGLIGAISLLKQHLHDAGYNATQSAQLLSRAFGGGRSSSAIMTMVNNLDVLKKKQDQVNRTAGKFESAVKAQRKTAQAQWALLRSSLDVTMVRIGTALLPPVTSFVRYVNNKAFPAVAGLAKSAKTVLAPAFSHVFDGFKTGAKFMVDFGEGLAGRPLKPKHAMTVADIVAEQTGLDSTSAAKAGANLNKTIGSIFSGKGINADQLGKVLQQTIGKAISGIHDIGEMVSKLFGKVNWLSLGKKAATVAIPLIVGFINNLGNAFLNEAVHHPLDMLSFLANFVVVGRVAGIVGKLFGEVKLIGPLVKMFTVPLEKGGAFIEKGVVKLVKAAFGPLGKLMGELGGKIMYGLFSGVVNHAEPLAEFFMKIGPKLSRLLKSGGKPLVLVGIVLIDDLVKGAQTAWHAATGFFSRIGRDIVHGLKSGLSAAVHGIGHWLSAVFVDPIVNWVKDAFGIHSPSTVFDRIGRDLIAGFLAGIRFAFGSVAAWFSKFGGRVTGYLRGAGSWLISRGRSIISGLWSGISSRWSSVASWWLKFGARVVGYYATAGRWLIRKGSAIISGLYDGISKRWGQVGRWFGGFGARVAGYYARAGQWLVGKGGAIISGLYDGITAKMKGIGSWVKSHIVDPLVNAVKRFFHIKSPSRVFHDIGHNLIAGLLSGMAHTSGTDIAKTIFGDMPHALGEIVKSGLVKVSQLPGKAINAVKGLGGDFAKLVEPKTIGGRGTFSGGDMSAHSTSAAAAQSYAKSVLGKFGWGAGQMGALTALWNGESGWNNLAQNPSSSAFGIAQFLDSTWAGKTFPKTTNALEQVYDGLEYIKGSYGSPSAALGAWLSRSPHWYGNGLAGGIFDKPTLIGVGERGRERVDVTPLGGRSSGSGDVAARLGNIEKLLGMYLAAGHNLEVNIDGRKITKSLNDQNVRTGPGSRLGRG